MVKDRLLELLESVPHAQRLYPDLYVDTLIENGVGIFPQTMWERDMAISQLKGHGIPFGGIAPDVVKVVRCKDCKYLCLTPDDPIGMVAWCPRTGTRFLKGILKPWTETHYCEVGERKDDG